jgi:hypothetical protein
VTTRLRPSCGIGERRRRPATCRCGPVSSRLVSMKPKPADAASAPLSAVLASLLNLWRPKQAAASELNWPMRSDSGLGEPRPQALRSMSPTNIGAVLRELEGPLKVAHTPPSMSERQTLRARADRLLACVRRYPSQSVCARSSGSVLVGSTTSTAPSEGQLSALPHLATVAERGGVGRNRGRPTRHSTRQVRASRALQLVPAQANRCRYS